MASLVRASLEEKLDQLDAKETAAQEREAEALKPKRKTNTVAGIVPLDQRPGVDLEIPKAVDRLASIFKLHAERIAEVVHDPQALRDREREALAAIRRIAPLTYGDDEKIVARLESYISEKALLEMEMPPTPTTARSQAPTVTPTDVSNPFEALSKLAQLMTPQPTADDPLVGKSINVSRIRSRTVIQDDSHEDE